MSVKNDPSGKLMVLRTAGGKSASVKEQKSPDSSVARLGICWLGQPHSLAPVKGVLPMGDGQGSRIPQKSLRVSLLVVLRNTKAQRGLRGVSLRLQHPTAKAARMHRMKLCLYIDRAIRFFSASNRGQLHVAFSTDFSGNHGFPLRRR